MTEDKFAKIEKVRKLFEGYDNSRTSINHSLENWSDQIMWGFHILNVLENGGPDEEYIDSLSVMFTLLKEHMIDFQKKVMDDATIQQCLNKINSLKPKTN